MPDAGLTYTLPEAAFTPSTVALSGKVNNNFSDIATALSARLQRGETTVFTRTLLDDADAATARLTLGAAGFADLAPYRNRLINGAMQISQEFGTSNTDVTTGSVYVLDQVQAFLSTTPGGTLRCAQVASVTPAGSNNRLRGTVQVADASIATGDAYRFQFPVEGQTMADARFGSASARQLLLRIGVRSSIAGTFAIAVQNAARTRSYVATFAIAGGEIGTDVLRTFVIPGDTAGTWATDTTAWGVVLVTLAAGTTFQGTAGSWQAANINTTSAQTNLMGTSSATFDVFDAGLYVDTLGLGILPAFDVPDPAAELIRCQRRYVRTQATHRFLSAGAQLGAVGVYWPVSMAGAPTVSITAGTRINVASATTGNVTTQACRYEIQATGAGDCAALNDLIVADIRL